MITISLKIIPKGPIGNQSSFNQVMSLAPSKQQAITSTNQSVKKLISASLHNSVSLKGLWRDARIGLLKLNMINEGR